MQLLIERVVRAHLFSFSRLVAVGAHFDANDNLDQILFLVWFPSKTIYHRARSSGTQFHDRLLSRNLFETRIEVNQMAATDLNELKLNGMKNWYQHWKEHLYFSNHAKFQHIRCYISLGNVRWNLTNLQTFVWLVVYVIPPVRQTSVNFSFFNLHFLSWYCTWYAETLQGY